MKAKLRGHNSKFDGTGYWLHGYEIAEATTSGVYLNTYGYRTATTKTHMNDALRLMGYDDWRVYQKDYAWFVGNNRLGVVIPFDGRRAVVPAGLKVEGVK